MDYYTGLLNAVERSVHLHARYKLTADKENKGLFAHNDVFGITPQEVR